MELSKKINRINPSTTLSITAKAKALKESGVDVVSFGAGEPDYNTPRNIIEAAKRAMDEGKTKYTSSNGLLELREAICEKFIKDNDLRYNPDEIVVSTGAKQSLANVFMSILNPGDEVIVPIPYWVSYPELIKLSDGKVVFIETKEKDNYKYKVEDLEAVVTSKTKALVINSPNNPTGTIYSKKELEDIAEFAKKHDILIISDEIYEKLIYDNNKHISIASVSEDAFKRTIVINGLSKAYAMTGWRVGYSASTLEMAKLMTKLQSHMTSNVNSIAQYAAIEALTGPKEEVNNMVIEFEKRRNFMVDRLLKIKDVNIIKPNGAFYVMVNISKYYGKSINGKKITNSLEFSTEILKEKKVAIIPGIAFGLDNYIRLSYAISIEVIEKGLNRIEEFLNTLK